MPAMVRKMSAGPPPRTGLVAGLREAGIDPSTLQFALLTHVHWDHIQGLAELPGVPARISPAEMPLVPSDAPPVAAYYNSAINKDAAHPAAARCWMEYVFSDAGQNTWLKGFALPVRLAAMQKAGTTDQAALSAVNAPATAPVQLTPAQIDTAKKYLTDNWKFISIK